VNMYHRDSLSKAASTVRVYASSKTGRQTLVLYSSHIALIFLGFIICSLNGRILGTDNYGIYAFLFTITAFSVLFFRFGFFSSGGLLLAQAKGNIEERRLIGALVVVALLIGVSYSLFIFGISFFVDRIFGTNVKHILQILSPVLILLPFQMLIPQIGRGANKIKKLAYFNILPKGLYVVAVLCLLALMTTGINVVVLIFLHFICVVFGVAVIIYSFKPLFNHLRDSIRKLWQKNKEYGVHLYFGQVVDQSTYKLDGIFISYFVNTTQLGFYSLAAAITSPMAMLSQSLSTSLFKGFAERERIPKRVTQLNFLWLLVCVVGLVVFGRLIVVVLLTERFLPVVRLILPLALAGFFRGMYQPYNTFLGAKGKGKWLRNVSVIEACFNVVGNLFFVIYLGVIGVAIASFIAKLLSFGSHYYYYRKYLRGI